MNKVLKANLYEIQAILYFILAELVKWDWLKIGLRAYATVTLISMVIIVAKNKEAFKKDSL